MLIVVALVSAFVAMRLAIHGREAIVPPVTGLVVADAAGAVARQGLHLTVENRFYSAEVTAGHVIAQDPPAGFRVRRDWPVRITESLGSQRVAVPNLIGQSERAAMIEIRQLGLEQGSIVHIAAPGDPDVVIAQDPAADAGQMATPHISLLVSDSESDATAYAMPSLVGLTYAAALARAAGVGLKLVPEADAAAAKQETQPAKSGSGIAVAAEPPGEATVIAQSVVPGHRVQQGSAIHVTVAGVVP